jgi:hypothetical protein
MSGQDVRFELGVLRDGGMMLVTNRTLPKPLKRVEFYRDMKLFKLVYDDGSDDGDLIEYEVTDAAAEMVKHSAQNILVVNAENPQDPEGFDVPLIQVGV